MTETYGSEFIQKFESFAPKQLAEAGDPVGLAVGTLNKPIKKMMVTLDIRPEVVQEAIEKQVDFIFAHHPPIFRPIKNLATDNAQINMYADLLKQDITVYAAHTNLDVATNGMNTWLADALALKETEIMHVTKQFSYKKIAVFVPRENEAEVRKALTDAGAGQIGPNYKDCTYTFEGVGRFTPINQANPKIGELDQPERVAEARIEVVFPEQLTQTIEKALFEAHPYEEPPYDLYTIENFVDEYGLGRVGNLTEPISVHDFAQKVKDLFGVSGLRYVTPDKDKLIQRVAVCGGDAGKYYPDALKKNADVFITGDVYYHTAHDMLADGLSVIDPGHHIESICKPRLVDLFTEWKTEAEWDFDIIQSDLNTDPYSFI
ncbi:dinuclear metal center protein, YbgI/SA1388 family [Carnobacterium alterfunditum]|uniref:GTP cyclohydrolase 1 type 2 homolog n=1 Tax=Carnobacterium alterfunditum TaxID=28230 RepID=A0A1N6H223_9LACT|nr:Nif3-like dinuclear metal center hexameric protein [Carnobacterium alterfunditum]SIO13725.1 dinuclear metal center protein, YbgI/SA1388 family [Carnobacterium alterfunditum]